MKLTELKDRYFTSRHFMYGDPISPIAIGIFTVLVVVMFSAASCKSLDPGPDGRLFPASDDYNKGFKEGFHQGVAEGVLLTQ